jgi:dihydroneopterin aldolase
MLTVSLHGMQISAARGLYKEEHAIQNHFEVDVDVFVNAADPREFPFIDYTIIRETVRLAFEQPHELLEQFIRDINTELKTKFREAEKVRIVIRKLNPPMGGQTAYSQVAYEG